MAKNNMFSCPSINKVGHTVEKATDNVKKVLEQSLDNDVKVTIIMRDNGGGGAVQNLHPVPVEMEVMM